MLNEYEEASWLFVLLHLRFIIARQSCSLRLLEEALLHFAALFNDIAALEECKLLAGDTPTGKAPAVAAVAAAAVAVVLLMLMMTMVVLLLVQIVLLVFWLLLACFAAAAVAAEFAAAALRGSYFIVCLLLLLR